MEKDIYSLGTLRHKTIIEFLSLVFQLLIIDRNVNTILYGKDLSSLLKIISFCLEQAGCYTLKF